MTAVYKYSCATGSCKVNQWIIIRSSEDKSKTKFGGTERKVKYKGRKSVNFVNNIGVFNEQLSIVLNLSVWTERTDDTQCTQELNHHHHHRTTRIICETRTRMDLWRQRLRLQGEKKTKRRDKGNDSIPVVIVKGDDGFIGRCTTDEGPAGHKHDGGRLRSRKRRSSDVCVYSWGPAVWFDFLITSNWKSWSHCLKHRLKLKRKMQSESSIVIQ